MNDYITILKNLFPRTTNDQTYHCDICNGDYPTQENESDLNLCPECEYSIFKYYKMGGDLKKIPNNLYKIQNERKYMKF